MSADILRPPGHLPPKDTLKLTSQAPAILKSLRPPFLQLPYPLSLLTSPETPERWQIYENLLIACLKSSDDATAFACIEALTTRFGPENERVQALRGLYREATAKNEKEMEAILKDYEDEIKAKDSNMFIRKRRVGLLKSMGRTQEALRALVKIVDFSPVDAEAWAEMGDINASLGLWDKSVYCWEEVLLIVPNAWNAHARLAEIEWMWASGTEEAREKIRLISSSLRRYCRSIELCDDYLRGYYGLKLTSEMLLEITRKPQKGAADVSGDLAPPPPPALESLSELATSKLAEIVRRGTAGETGWDGYDEAELIAAKELLNRDTQKLQR